MLYLMIQVGKLNDEAVDDFITELKNINFFAEGEAQRYFEVLILCKIS